MPRKKKESKEEQPVTPEEQEVMQGHPEHGQAFEEAGQEPPPEEPGSEPPPSEQPPEPDRFQAIDQRFNNLERLISRLVPPREEKKQEPPAPEPPDFEKLLFENPNEALRMHGEIVADRVKNELTQAYQRERNTETFWTRFFDTNPDLKGDRDLVEMTLNKNLSAMADMPVDEAISKLADLTRERILQYAGRQSKGSSKRVHTEGSRNEPSTPPPKDEPEITTLSDLIRTRQSQKATAA